MSLSVAELSRLAQQAFDAGRWRRAEEFLVRLVALDAGPRLYFMLGVCRHKQGNLGDALPAFEQAIAADPESPDAYFAAISVSCAAGNLEYARQLCDRLLELVPYSVQAHTTAGTVLELLGEKQQALIHYDRALLADSAAHDALLNRGALLLQMQCFAEAKANNVRLSDLFPERWTSHFNMAEALAACGEIELAADAYGRARTLCPTSGKALLQEAYALARLGQYDRAQPLLDEAWRSHHALVQADWRRFFPSAPPLSKALNARSLFFLLGYAALEQCDWRGYAEFVKDFSDFLGRMDCPAEYPLAFRALVLGVSPALQLKLAKSVAASFLPSSVFAVPQEQRLAEAQSVIRIAYLSANFGRHAAGLIAHRLFDLHDRAHFEVFAYAIGPRYDDEIREGIEFAADHFADLSGFSDEAAALAIAGDGIDILIDLSGYTDFARPGIMARRPAPVQMACIAYPATSGAPWMDYLVLDETTADADTDTVCSEQVIRMPDAMAPCSYADTVLLPTGRHEAGVPEDGVLLAAFHSHYKIDPTIFAIWMRLLVLHADAYLWLLQGDGDVEENLRQEAIRVGVDPARLIFARRLAHEQHLSRFSLADMFLDTPVCNGGSTVCDALVAGVPVLTCKGHGIAQRLAAGYLKSAGFVEGISANLSEYESKALDWLANPDKLRSLREKLELQRRYAPFYHLERWVSDFERALMRVHQLRLGGMKAQAFAVRDIGD